MRVLKGLILLSFIMALLGCEPIRITTKVAPFEVEPPKEAPQVKKLPYEAIVLVDDTKTYSATEYSADVIHTVEFPAGSLLRQALPIYFDRMFNQTRYEKKLSYLIPPNRLLIHATVDNLNFSEKCCYRLEVKARTKFSIYDSDLIEVALPVFGVGSGTISKSGLFSPIIEKDYGTAAYQAIFNSLNPAVDSIYEVLNNPKTQISEAKGLINKDPSNTLAYRVLASLSLKINDIPEALAASQMLIQLAPKDPNGYLLLYKSYLAQRRYKEAQAQLEQAVSLDPKNAILLMKLHDVYIEKEKYERAIEAVKRYIEHRSDDRYAPFKLGLLYFRLGKYDEAIKISEKAIKNLSFSGIGASITKNEGEYAKVKLVEPNSPAEKAELQANYEILEIDGKSTLEMKFQDIIQNIRGQENTEVKLKVRKPGSEEITIKTLVRRKFYTDPFVASYMSLIALSSLEINDNINAKKYIEEAEKISPQDNYLKLAKASLYLKENQYEKSITEAISLKDEDYAKFLQAIAYAKLGKYEESFDLYKKLIKSKSLLITNRKRDELISALFPYIETIENKAIRFERAGQPAKALGEYARLLEILGMERAQQIISRVARIISQNPSLVELKGDARKHFLQAEVLFNKEKFVEALEELDLALQLQPFNPQIYFNKAVIYEKLSDYKEAIENMEIFLKINPSTPNAQMIKDQIYKWRFMHEKEI